MRARGNGLAASAGFDRLSLPANRDLLVALARAWCRGHALLDLTGHRHESILDIGRVLCGRLEEGNADRTGEFLGRLRLHLPLGCEVALVADKQLVDILRCIPINLVQPRLHVFKRLGVGGVINDDDAVRPPVVAAGDRAEALLASRVPNLQFDRLPVQLDRADFLHTHDGPLREGNRFTSSAR